MRRSWLPAYLLAGSAVVALELAWNRRGYWNYSDGVYLQSSRLVLHGAELYREVIAAQPPALYYAGAALMAVDDSIWWVRGALSALALLLGALVALAAWRLTASRLVAVLAGVGALLAPWTLREHWALTPETFGAPLLLGGALLATERRWAAVGGVLAGAAVAFKLPYLLPAAAIAVAAPRFARARFAVGVGATVALAAAVSLAAWGGALIDDAVSAQGEVGTHLDQMPGYVAQSVWNLGPLLALAAGALAWRSRLRDPALLRVMWALLAATVALLATLVKRGAYLNAIQVIEPAAVALATAGAFCLIRERGRAGAALAAVAVGLMALQTGSLLVTPRDPGLFARPLSRAAPGEALSDDGVAAAVAAARRCPPGVADSGPPYVAFVAGRRVPADQPDGFVLTFAPIHAAARARAAAGPRCP
jgi:hypothetical protein